MSERLRICGNDRPVVGDLVFEEDVAKVSSDVEEELDATENG